MSGSHLRMMNLFRNSHVLDLQIAKNFGNRIDGSVGNIAGVQSRQPIGARFFAELLTQDLDDFIVTVRAVLSGEKTGVADQRVKFRRFEQSFPSFVVAGKVNHEGFVVAVEKAVDAAFGKILTGHSLATVQIVSDVGFDERDAHLQQRYVDELTAVRFSACKQGGHNPVGSENTGGVIHEGNAGDLWIVEIGYQTHHPTERLTNGVEARLIAIGAALTVSGDRAMNQF